MITKIGIVAGEIWHYLDQHKNVKLSDLFSNIEHPRDIILMSVGWLAREGHIILEEEGGDFKVALRR